MTWTGDPLSVQLDANRDVKIRVMEPDFDLVIRFLEGSKPMAANVEQQRSATLYAFDFLVPTTSGCVALNELNFYQVNLALT